MLATIKKNNMRKASITLLILLLISCQNSTYKVDESFNPIVEQKVEKEVEIIMYGYVAIVYAVPSVIKTSRWENFNGTPVVAGVNCIVINSDELWYTDIKTFTNFIPDDEYRLLDYAVKDFRITHSTNDLFYYEELRDCPNKEEYKNSKVEINRKKFFLFDSYQDASIHKENNKGNW